MKVDISIDMNKNKGVYVARIEVNKKFFKEVSGGGNIQDALNCITDSLKRDPIEIKTTK